MRQSWCGLLASILLCTTTRTDVAAACKSTCSDELRACRTRCDRLQGVPRRHCRDRCEVESTCSAAGVRLRTAAYTVNACTGDATGHFAASEELVVRHGNCDPVTLMELPSVGPVADPLGLCAIYGQFRIGAGSVAIARFQRIGVTPDGTGVVFELTNEHSVFPPVTPAPPDTGIFFIRRDGSGLRKLGPASQVPLIEVVPDPTSTLGLTLGGTGATFALTFNPSGTLFAYEDLGPGPDGADASQVFVMEVATGARRQVTRVPAGPAGGPVSGNAFFVDDRTLLFWNAAATAPYRVNVDGSHLRPIPNTIAIPGATVVPQFGVARRGTNVFPVHFPESPARSYAPGDDTRELFVIDGQRALQLTKLGFPDTGVYSQLMGDLVVFGASADPLGENPQGICQLFSITTLGAALRQLTHLPADGREKRGCAITAPDLACRLNGLVLDPVTRVVAFLSSCDPFGRNPNGEQFFAMRPDGTRLRQTSAFRGVERLPDGGVHVEMAGPAEYSSVFR